mgnify:FL=1
MPVIQVRLMEGRSDSEKQAKMRWVTDAVVETLGVRPSSVRIMIHELASGHFAVAGEPRFAEHAEEGADTNGHSLSQVQVGTN